MGAWFELEQQQSFAILHKYLLFMGIPRTEN